MIFSKRANQLVASATMKATLKAQNHIKNGEDIVLGSVGEPDSKPPASAKKEVINYLNSHDSKYGPAQGLPSTRKIISTWMNQLYKQNWSSENVVISPGSKFGLYSLFQILGDDNSEVIIPSPYWVSYVTLAKLSGASIQVIPCSASENYKLTAAKLKNELSKKTKALTKILLLNSPQNPTGAIYTQSELIDLAKVIATHPDLLVICDDIYNQLIFSDEPRCPHLLDVLDKEHHQRVILVHGASKSFALTGWRLGWVVASSEIINKLTDFQSQTLTCMPDFLQIALEKILQNENQYVNELKELIKTRHQRAISKLQTCPGIKLFLSQGAFYVWMEVLDKSKTSSQICDELLTQFGVALVPGSSFGCEYHLRFSVTISDTLLDKGLLRIINYFTINGNSVQIEK